MKSIKPVELTYLGASYFFLLWITKWVWRRNMTIIIKLWSGNVTNSFKWTELFGDKRDFCLHARTDFQSYWVITDFFSNMYERLRTGISRVLFLFNSEYGFCLNNNSPNLCFFLFDLYNYSKLFFAIRLWYDNSYHGCGRFLFISTFCRNCLADWLDTRNIDWVEKKIKLLQDRNKRPIFHHAEKHIVLHFVHVWSW